MVHERPRGGTSRARISHLGYVFRKCPNAGALGTCNTYTLADRIHTASGRPFQGRTRGSEGRKVSGSVFEIQRESSPGARAGNGAEPRRLRRKAGPPRFSLGPLSTSFARVAGLRFPPQRI